MKKYLFSFSIICVITIFNHYNIAYKSKYKPADISQNSNSLLSISNSIADRQPQQTINLSSANKGNISIKSPVSTISLAVTKEEIAMREQQVKIAEKLKREAELKFQAAVGSSFDVSTAEYFVLSNKIRLLQAKQLLQLKQQQKEDKNSLTKIYSRLQVNEVE